MKLLCRIPYLLLLLEKKKTSSKLCIRKEEETKSFAINRNSNMNLKQMMNNLLSYLQIA